MHRRFNVCVCVCMNDGFAVLAVMLQDASRRVALVFALMLHDARLTLSVTCGPFRVLKSIALHKNGK